MIPFFKPIEIPWKEIDYDIAEILRRGQFSNGTWCRTLEEKIKEMYDVKHAITCSSCSQGLIMAVNYLREEMNCEIIGLPAFTWYSTFEAIKINNLVHFFMDIDRTTFLSNINTILSFDKPIHMGAIMVDTFGNKSNIEPTNIPLIYDCAQSLGVEEIGNRGLAEVFSLAPSKMFTAMEGGIITTNYDQVAEFILKLRDKISRMEEINAIVGLWHLNHKKEIQNNKRIVKEYYFDKFPEFAFSLESYSQITVLYKNSYKILKKLEGKVELRKYYEPLYPLPNSQWVYDHILCLPSYYGVDYKKVVEEIKKVI